MQVVEGQTANGRCSIRVRLHTLPQHVAAALDDNAATMSRTFASDTGKQVQRARSQMEAGGISEI